MLIRDHGDARLILPLHARETIGMALAPQSALTILALYWRYTGHSHQPSILWACLPYTCALVRVRARLDAISPVPPPPCTNLDGTRHIVGALEVQTGCADCI